MSGKSDETRDGVSLTNLDQPLFDAAEATKRDLVDYLDGVRDRILPVLEDRPLSVIRVHRGQEAFMQKNVPRYTPDWVRTVRLWSESSRRDVDYALCDDRRTLIWFANQRAVEYHPTLVLASRLDAPTHLVIDIDPPEDGAFAMAARAARLVRAALAELGLAGALKTSGSKGVHVYVPVDGEPSMADAAAAIASPPASGTTGTKTCTPLAPLVFSAPASPALASASRTSSAVWPTTENAAPAGGSMSRTRCVWGWPSVGWYSTARWLANQRSVERSLHSA